MFRVGIVRGVLLCAALETAKARLVAQSMAYGCYAGLKEADLADIIAYLRTVPPLQ